MTHQDLLEARKKKCAILVRVSTSKQDTDRQVSDLKKVAHQRGFETVEICREVISGASDADQRLGLHRVLELAVAGEIGHVLTTEVSRLARKNSVCHKFLEDLTDLGVNLYWHTQGIDTLLANGKVSPSARIMFALMAEKARSDLDELSDRIKSGLAEAKRKGRKLGRPSGTSMSAKEFLAKHKDIVRRLRDGLSVRVAAAATGKSPFTVQKVRKIMEVV
ncbi:recombinase family protein [bacterium]|nr:recombinase family protein [Akkermansiaceae bacterium]MDA7919305.1 recombinase family protein [Akkermansiaceae bacterium]MDB4397723.1 recombinase family protein [Akkermansiaceae bacterium]MDB4816789.1 recombinase family protein [bacterium]|tara:strand:- start:915 stop:1574 length:660 start_codon:yes stop_codon:yes gene_type:complete